MIGNTREEDEELDAQPVGNFTATVYLNERQRKALWAVAMDWVVQHAAAGGFRETGNYIGQSNYNPEIIHLRDVGLIENGLSFGPKENPDLKGARWVLTKKGRAALS